LDQILRDGLVCSAFQPIVDLATGALFGFEALARGPKGSALEYPKQLFGAARAEGRLAELDQACQRAALAGAHANRIEAPLALFVNAEPASTGFGQLPPLGKGVRGVIELTERTVTTGLGVLLSAVERARRAGWGIALDDVGADARSLALMPFFCPDIIKLDRRLVQGNRTSEAAAIAREVHAEAQFSGATVVAEGIETPEQARHARALGATLGQGFLFGRPSLGKDYRRASATIEPNSSARYASEYRYSQSAARRSAFRYSRTAPPMKIAPSTIEATR
jgi:EAL domain-containing protein (putative c-di-GMP-specific phosphodiesterase class I)